MSGLFMSACSTAWQSTYETTKAALISSDSLINQVKLDPKYRYLRFEANGHAVLLPLGFLDSHQDGPIEVWYGGDPIMIRLQNGRYFGSKGLESNWEDIRVSHLPNFIGLQHPQSYVRVRRQTPGSEFGIREKVLLSPIDQAPAIAPKFLKEMSTGTDRVSASSPIRWFSEAVVPDPSSTSQSDSYKLHAFYAVDISKSQIVFGYQCLKRDYCISWQAWPSPWLNKERHE